MAVAAALVELERACGVDKGVVVCLLDTVIG